jgi:hypothetical protein
MFSINYDLKYLEYKTIINNFKILFDKLNNDNGEKISMIIYISKWINNNKNEYYENHNSNIFIKKYINKFINIFTNNNNIDNYYEHLSTFNSLYNSNYFWNKLLEFYKLDNFNQFINFINYILFQYNNNNIDNLFFT